MCTVIKYRANTSAGSTIATPTNIITPKRLSAKLNDLMTAKNDYYVT